MNIGDLILVEYGFQGRTQVACVVGDLTTCGWKVSKWLHSSLRWGAPVRLRTRQIRGLAPDNDPRSRAARAHIAEVPR